jgi:hypothetical protein
VQNHCLSLVPRCACSFACIRYLVSSRCVIILVSRHYTSTSFPFTLSRAHVLSPHCLVPMRLPSFWFASSIPMPYHCAHADTDTETHSHTLITIVFALVIRLQHLPKLTTTTKTLTLYRELTSPPNVGAQQRAIPNVGTQQKNALR